MEDLSDYLGRVAAAFLDGKDADPAGLSPENTAWCCGFFYYSIQLFANGLRGTVDDLIQLAEAYERSSNIIHIVWTENLPPNLSEDADKWIMSHKRAPTHLSDCVTAAIAVLLGVMEEPKMLDEETAERDSV